MKTILIIEDNEEIRENTAELLDINHYHVLSAGNGYTGFEMARQNQPDLILCDMMMPESDGSAFLKLAKNDPAIQKVPIIFFSAGTVSIKDQNNLIAAADGYLKKPFLETELLSTIQEVMDKRIKQLSLVKF